MGAPMTPTAPAQTIEQTADTLDREGLALENIGVRGVPRIARKMSRAMIAWTRGGLIGRPNLQEPTDELTALLTDAMVAGDLMGRLRTTRMAAVAIEASLGPEHQVALATPTGSLYDKAVAFVQDRTTLSPEQVQGLKDAYQPAALEVTKHTTEAVEAAGRQAASQIVGNGMHVRQGIGVMRQKLTDAGMSPAKPWLYETLVRTQTQVAYGAGRWTAAQDPSVQEILWGWEYKTVGDDRVRLKHQSLDGIKLPKNHPRWRTIWPPNGYNCRCVVVEIFKDQEKLATLQEPPPSTTIDGVTVIPGADKGWEFNPGEVYGSATGQIPLPKKPIVPKLTKPKTGPAGKVIQTLPKPGQIAPEPQAKPINWAREPDMPAVNRRLNEMGTKADFHLQEMDKNLGTRAAKTYEKLYTEYPELDQAMTGSQGLTRYTEATLREKVRGEAILKSGEIRYNRRWWKATPKEFDAATTKDVKLGWLTKNTAGAEATVRHEAGHHLVEYWEAQSPVFKRAVRDWYKNADFDTLRNTLGKIGTQNYTEAFCQGFAAIGQTPANELSPLLVDLARIIREARGAIG